MKIDPNMYHSILGYDLEDIEALEAGERGYQKEEGFDIVEDDDAHPPVVTIPVFAVLCRSKRHPVPQYRYLSPYEMTRGVLEVADRLVAVRIDVANQDLSELVVGRSDDVAEEIRENGGELAADFLGRKLRPLIGISLEAIGRLLSFATRLPDLIRGTIDRA